MELLVVISILGIMAALTVPVFKHFGKSDATISASAQLLDDIARARQLAMSQRTTVYMVFVPTNFWNNPVYNSDYVTWQNKLSVAQQIALTNLCDKQLTGYTFISLRSVGDQPGQSVPRYLADWQTLPEGTYITEHKFKARTSLPVLLITNQVTGEKISVYGFDTNSVPFPTADSPSLNLPCVAFDYRGQLTPSPPPGEDGENIPLARGTVAPAISSTNRAFRLDMPAISEMPPGNSTNFSFNVIHVDWLTGRGTLKYQKVQ